MLSREIGLRRLRWSIRRICGSPCCCPALLERFGVHAVDMAEATGDVVGRKIAKFCGSRSAPDASAAFMSVLWTPVSAHSPALLATDDGVNGRGYPSVLMHLLVLGAF